MEVLIVKAKEDLAATPDTWTEGREYEVTDREVSFSITSNQARVSYVNSVRDLVLENFEIVRTETLPEAEKYSRKVDI